MVELVERPLGEHDVPLRVDVRADVEEDLLVVVDVDELVDDDHATSTGSACPRPQIACITLRACPGNALRIETITQLWNAPATGRS